MAFEAFISFIIDLQISKSWGVTITKQFFPHKNIIIESMQTYHDPLHNVNELGLFNKALHT